MKHKAILLLTLIACLLPTLLSCDDGVISVTAPPPATVELSGDEYQKILIWDEWSAKMVNSVTSNKDLVALLERMRQNRSSINGRYIEVRVFVKGDSPAQKLFEKIRLTNYTVYEDDWGISDTVAKFVMKWNDVEGAAFLEMAAHPAVVQIRISAQPVNDILDDA